MSKSVYEPRNWGLKSSAELERNTDILQRYCEAYEDSNIHAMVELMAEDAFFRLFVRGRARGGGNTRRRRP